jgi:RNA polymerase sigma-70 factor (ECF subfamily)
MSRLLLNITDAELIKQAQHKKANPASGVEAVGELYDRYHDLVFRYIWSRVSDPQLAEDLTGDVFIRMVVNLPRYRLTGAPFRAWLLSIARNLIIDDHRKASYRDHLPIEKAENLKAENEAPPKVVENRLYIEEVQKALQELKPIKQDILILRFIVGLPLREVAAALGKTVGSIKVTQHRALKELRMILESESGTQL